MRRRAWSLVALLVGCSGPNVSGVPKGQRLVTGRAFVQLTGQQTRPALQIVGIYADKDCSSGGVVVGQAAAGVKSCAIFGPPFDPGELGGGVKSQPFQIQLPCDRTVNLLVQIEATSGGQAPGQVVALLAWPTGNGDDETTLLAAEPACRDTPELATNVIDLGQFTVPAQAQQGMPVTILLGGPTGGTNPLATIDTDGDSIPNVADADDDDDGLDDPVDTDEDGDGIPDAAEVFQPSWLGANM